MNESLGVSPSQILFGNAISLDRGLFVPYSKELDKVEQLSAWTSRMLQAQENILQLAKRTQKIRDDKHLSAQGAVTEFPINSYVLVQYENKEHRPPTKLHTYKKGPMRVVNFIGSRYTLQNLVTNKLEDYHVLNLSPFVYDPTRTDPRLVANADHKVTDVERILEHRGSIKRKSQMKFKVRWAGQTEAENTWEPWASLRTSHFLFQYLVSRNLKSLIPTRFKNQY